MTEEYTLCIWCGAPSLYTKEGKVNMPGPDGVVKEYTIVATFCELHKEWMEPEKWDEIRAVFEDPDAEHTCLDTGEESDEVN